jgi:hypothetical protein
LRFFKDSINNFYLFQCKVLVDSQLHQVIVCKRSATMKARNHTLP